MPGNLGVFTRRARQGGSDHFFLLSDWSELGRDPPALPALVGVAALSHPEYMLEVDAIAVV